MLQVQSLHTLQVQSLQTLLVKSLHSLQVHAISTCNLHINVRYVLHILQSLHLLQVQLRYNPICNLQILQVSLYLSATISTFITGTRV